MSRSTLLLLLCCAAACAHAGAGEDLEAHPATSASPSVPAESASPSVPAEPAARELARAAQAELQRDDPEAGPPAAAALAKRHGGWVASMAAQSVTIEVPGDQLDAVLVELPALGKVTERRLTARDVTRAHRDLRVRIDSLRRERERYLALLDRTANVSEATQVEHEIERLTSQLELLQAQLQAVGEAVQDVAVRLDFSRELKPGLVGYVFWALYSGVKWLFVRD
jgi:hypothetical protein